MSIDRFARGIWFRLKPTIGIGWFWGALSDHSVYARRWGFNVQIGNWRWECALANKMSDESHVPEFIPRRRVGDTINIKPPAQWAKKYDPPIPVD